MTVINTNVSSILAQNSLKANSTRLSSAMERLSTGSRINSAKDDAAGLAIGSRMESQMRGLTMAIKNANDGISLTQTAEGGMTEISNMLQRMRELSIQSANGVNNSGDRALLDAEVQQLKAEIDRVVSSTRFNDTLVMDGSLDSTLQIGAKSNETLRIQINGLGTSQLGTLGGAASAQGVTSISANGTPAKVTTSNITFNGDDTYGFTLALNGNNYTISGAQVSAGNAQSVADKINAALRGGTNNTPPDISTKVRAVASGSTVTIQHLEGKAIALSGFTSSANGTANYSSVVGGNGSDNRTLTDATAVTSLANTGGTTATAAKAQLSLGVSTSAPDEVYTLTLNGVTMSLGKGVGVGGADVLTSDAMVSLINSYSAQTGVTASATLSGSNAAPTAATGQAFRALELTSASGQQIALSVNSSSGTLDEVRYLETTTVTATTSNQPVVNVGSTVATTGGRTAVAAEMSIAFTGNDTYSFKIDKGGASAPAATATITAIVANNDLTAMVAAVNTAFTNAGSDYSKFSASAVNGRLVIKSSDGTGFDITNFASSGNGTATVSNASGQGTSAVLDDSTYFASATTAAAGTATATEMTLKQSAADTYSFTLTDGRTNAVIRPTTTQAVSSATGTGYDALLAEIQLQLSNAGSDISAAYADANDKQAGIKFTNSKGGVVEMKNFMSAGTGTVTASPVAGQGVSKILDDNITGGASTAVAVLNISTQSGAQNAITVIDRAIEDVNLERSKLGAYQSRLSYTVNNLNNIVANTAQARSRIMDADYATETTNLAKAQIIQQAATAMLAQANQSAQSVLALLQ